MTAPHNVEITIEIDPALLAGHGDARLASLWHVAQANPAPHGDHAAGELVERVGREIIRRWLAAVQPELWRHQGRDYYWSQLCRLARFQPGDGPPGSPQWHAGTWVPRDAAAAPDPGSSSAGGAAPGRPPV